MSWIDLTKRISYKDNWAINALFDAEQGRDVILAEFWAVDVQNQDTLMVYTDRQRVLPYARVTEQYALDGIYHQVLGMEFEYALRWLRVDGHDHQDPYPSTPATKFRSPTTLADQVARLTYKPGWLFTLEKLHGASTPGHGVSILVLENTQERARYATSIADPEAAKTDLRRLVGPAVQTTLKLESRLCHKAFKVDGKPYKT